MLETDEQFNDPNQIELSKQLVRAITNVIAHDNSEIGNSLEIMTKAINKKNSELGITQQTKRMSDITDTLDGKRQT